MWSTVLTLILQQNRKFNSSSWFNSNKLQLLIHFLMGSVLVKLIKKILINKHLLMHRLCIILAKPKLSRRTKSRLLHLKTISSEHQTTSTNSQNVLSNNFLPNLKLDQIKALYQILEVYKFLASRNLLDPNNLLNALQQQTESLEE